MPSIGAFFISRLNNTNRNSTANRNLITTYHILMVYSFHNSCHGRAGGDQSQDRALRLSQKDL